MYEPTLHVWALEQVTENHRNLSDAHVKDEPGPLEDTAITDKGRRKQSSPTKRRKIEHDSSLNLLEVWTCLVADLAGLHFSSLSHT